jgi:hypothetical protein
LSLVEQVCGIIIWQDVDCAVQLTCPKVSLLRAADHWRTVAIPHKGIPNIKTSDGPNGARGAVFKAGTRVRMLSSHHRSNADISIGCPFPLWCVFGSDLGYQITL